MIEYSKLQSEIPHKAFNELIDVTTKFNINTPLRLAHFLGQCAHESANFTRIEENLNYSADRLLKVFPRYFDEHSAHDCERDPYRIACRVYANRMGNGPEGSGEGWFYRGRGYMQLTGADNYRAFDKVVADNISVNPELVATKYPLLSAAWFWDSRDLNKYADNNEIETITRRINGGLNGIDDRLKQFERFRRLISDV